MKISMYLGPSKYWWAWLGCRSNPAIAEAAKGYDRVIMFDDPRRLPSSPHNPRRRTKYFHVFWDGIRDAAEIERTRLSIGPEAALAALVVGEATRSSNDMSSVLPLYPEGLVRFNVTGFRLDTRTSLLLFGARMKGFLMPLKNVAQSKGRRAETAGLLFGRRRIVFCGSYGTTQEIIAVLCARHSVDPRVFDGYFCFHEGPSLSFESFRERLENNARFLAKLYGSAAIDAGFLRSAIHLLGREYFIERLRSIGAPMFVHGYSGRANINPYTTPWYRQHLFLDFGSAVGRGNYPRLADLQYFRKRFIPIDVTLNADEIASFARLGELEPRFAAEWDRKEPQLTESAG